MYPDFLGIGAQKAGTSWLHSVLSQHKDIWLPHMKELHYFDRRFPPMLENPLQDRGSQQRGSRSRISQGLRRLRTFDRDRFWERLRLRGWGEVAWEARFILGKWDDEWYASLFDNGDGRITGEITPAYSCLGLSAIKHIHSLMPRAKLILVLRDPIDRAWSHARMDLASKGAGDPLAIKTADYIAHFEGSPSKLRGDYIGSIDRWKSYYPDEQLFVGFFDEIKSDPSGLLTRILGFLGASVSPGDLPRNLNSAVNVGRQAGIPADLYRHLALLYEDQLRILAERYGSYANGWWDRSREAV